MCESDQRQAGTSTELEALYQAELIEHFSTDQVGPLSLSEARFVARRLIELHALSGEGHKASH